MLKGLLFDLDGTLIDSNALHVRAWESTFEKHGFRVARDRIAVETGKGGDQLIPAILGEETDERDGDALRETNGKIYAELATKEGIVALPRAKALLTAVRARGISTALVTSGSAKQVELAEAASKVAWSELFDVVVNSDDSPRTKPAPDLILAGLRKLKMSAAQCAMIGDTPWDAESARHAGVAMLGVSFGGNPRPVLRRAGARAVYRDISDLLASLDEALRIASPGSADLDQRMIVRLMREALGAADQGMSRGEVPIGCVLARGDGTVIARGHNRYNETFDKARHAEMDTFAAAAGKLPQDARDTILVSTLEPCVMCMGAAMETAVDVVLYAMPAPEDGGTRRVTPPESAESQLPRAIGNVLTAESRALFDCWLERPGRNQAQEPYVRALLAKT